MHLPPTRSANGETYYTFDRFFKSPIFTWHNVTKPNGGHCDEAEVETIEETPILPHCEKCGTATEENAKKQKSSTDSVYVGCKTFRLLLIFLLTIKAKEAFILDNSNILLTYPV